ncbi:serine protease family S28 [Achlya hypogyna]|uniref:Serine protease family S28 n=1 Tax=Achlya hypogyna TaxID=1202772 RepID=A0A1V9ZIP0_ACHHY|nr:serine protease family S28 [Achlya hypogyna]
MVAKIALGLMGLGLASALHMPPTHARGGQLFQDLMGVVNLAPAPAAQWFQQKLDHFSSKPPLHFMQRYYVDDTFWGGEETSPIIIYIGGEGAMEKMPSGYIDVIAKAHQAKIVALEHRFYGKSVPKDDLSVENLGFLTVEQALADLKEFIEAYQQTLPTKHNPWVAVGGSYPGALSAWFRIAYPNTTVASLSSSGVVNPVYNFHAFDEQVALSAGKDCSDALRRITKAFEAEIAAGRSDEVKGLLGAQALADPDFFYMLADSAAMAVQYGKKDQLCVPMIAAVQANASLPEAFANFTIKMYGSAFGSGCFYDTQCLKNETSRWADVRSWRWQKCYQLAYFQVTVASVSGLTIAQVAPHRDSLRSSVVDLGYHEKQCYDIFGDVVDPSAGVAATIQRYGGDKPPGHKIFYANGGDDPWQRASVLASLGEDQPAFLAVCDLCGHCGDLGNSAADPPPRRRQKDNILYFLDKWIREAQAKVPAAGPAVVSADAVVTGPSAARVSFLVLLPIGCLFLAFKALLHVDIVRDASSVRTSLL